MYFQSVTEFLHGLQVLFEKVTERQTTKQILVMSPVLLKEHFVEQLADNSIKRVAKEHLVSNPHVTFANVREIVVGWEEEGPKISVFGKSEVNSSGNTRELNMSDKIDIIGELNMSDTIDIIGEGAGKKRVCIHKW